MAIVQNILNLDGYFKSSRGNKIIINDYYYFNIKDKDVLNNIMMTTYTDTELLSSKPSCDCGKTHSRYNIGRVCKHCGTSVIEPHDNVMPTIWLRAINQDLKFMNPNFWLMLNMVLKTKKKQVADWIRYLTDYRYNPPIEIPPHVLHIKEALGGIRDYAHFINNIPTVLNALLEHDNIKRNENKRNLVKGYIDLYNHYKEDLFSVHIPIVNKRLFVIENTNKGRYINLVSADTIDVVMSWLKLCSDSKLTPKKLSSGMANVLSRLANLYQGYYEQYIVGKSGAFRKHMYGARSHFTFRCVIVSRGGAHRHDQIEVPWVVGVSAFRPHIVNKLFKRGYSYKEINSMMYRHIKSYNQDIAEILDELVNESSDPRGIPCLALRNPSLRQGSSQLVYISNFKKDITDYTVNISVLIIKAPNGDYDGDELNFTMLLDNDMAKTFETLAPYYNIPDVSKPFEVCGNVSLMPCASTVLTNYLADKGSDGVDTIVDKLNFVKA